MAGPAATFDSFRVPRPLPRDQHDWTPSLALVPDFRVDPSANFSYGREASLCAYHFLASPGSPTGGIALLVSKHPAPSHAQLPLMNTHLPSRVTSISLPFILTQTYPRLEFVVLFPSVPRRWQLTPAARTGELPASPAHACASFASVLPKQKLGTETTVGMQRYTTQTDSVCAACWTLVCHLIAVYGSCLVNERRSIQFTL